MLFVIDLRWQFIEGFLRLRAFTLLLQLIDHELFIEFHVGSLRSSSQGFLRLRGRQTCIGVTAPRRSPVRARLAPSQEVAARSVCFVSRGAILTSNRQAVLDSARPTTLQE